MKVHYLGHVVSKEGISVDPENIRVIMEWATPRNMDEVRSLMGLIGDYKRFIKNFSLFCLMTLPHIDSTPVGPIPLLCLHISHLLP